MKPARLCLPQRLGVPTAMLVAVLASLAAADAAAAPTLSL